MHTCSDLEKYIYEEIVPCYSAFDPAHKEDHAMTVIGQAMLIMDSRERWLATQKDVEDIWKAEIDPRILLAAAACHDLGLSEGRERHHLESGIMIRADIRLREWFTEEEIEIIAQAAEDHRASGKSAPRSIYGMIVAEADRVIDGETIIRRTIQFGLKNYPELDREGHVARAVEHLQEKYGRGGYLKLWIPWSDNADRLAELQDLIADIPALTKEIKRLMKNIYFAGSIRGGRIDAGLYGRMIRHMQKTCIVLTEHVGSPHLNLMEQGKKDIDIYDQDTAWLRESDIVIAECTCPSLGVGYELAYAEKHGIPCHIFYDRTKTQLSAMLTGNPYFHIHPYGDEKEIYIELDKILQAEKHDIL